MRVYACECARVRIVRLTSSFILFFIFFIFRQNVKLDLKLSSKDAFFCFISFIPSIQIRIFLSSMAFVYAMLHLIIHSHLLNRNKILWLFSSVSNLVWDLSTEFIFYYPFSGVGICNSASEWIKYNKIPLPILKQKTEGFVQLNFKILYEVEKHVHGFVVVLHTLLGIEFDVMCLDLKEDQRWTHMFTHKIYLHIHSNVINLSGNAAGNKNGDLNCRGRIK